MRMAKLLGRAAADRAGHEHRAAGSSLTNIGASAVREALPCFSRGPDAFRPTLRSPYVAKEPTLGLSGAGEVLTGIRSCLKRLATRAFPGCLKDRETWDYAWQKWDRQGRWEEGACCPCLQTLSSMVQTTRRL